MVNINKLLWTANAIRLKMLGTEIGMPSYVGPVTCLIGARQIKVGKRVRIWPGARIEVYGDAILTIEDEVSIGVNSHITVAEDMTIGSQSVFSGNNLITNITHSLTEMHMHPLERPMEVVPVHLGRRLFVGHGAKILPGANLADGCVVGANAVVATLEAPENAVIVGVPGRVVKTAR